MTDEGRVRVTGIDNDLSFGRADRLRPSPANGLSRLPRLIDEQLAQRWNQLQGFCMYTSTVQIDCVPL